MPVMSYVTEKLCASTIMGMTVGNSQTKGSVCKLSFKQTVLMIILLFAFFFFFFQIRVGNFKVVLNPSADVSCPICFLFSSLTTSPDLCNQLG